MVRLRRDKKKLKIEISQSCPHRKTPESRIKNTEEGHRQERKKMEQVLKAPPGITLEGVIVEVSEEEEEEIDMRTGEVSDKASEEDITPNMKEDTNMSQTGASTRDRIGSQKTQI